MRGGRQTGAQGGVVRIEVATSVVPLSGINLACSSYRILHFADLRACARQAGGRRENGVTRPMLRRPARCLCAHPESSGVGAGTVRKREFNIINSQVLNPVNPSCRFRIVDNLEVPCIFDNVGKASEDPRIRLSLRIRAMPDHQRGSAKEAPSAHGFRDARAEAPQLERHWVLTERPSGRPPTRTACDSIDASSD